MVIWFLGERWREGRCRWTSHPQRRCAGAQALSWQFVQGKGKGGEELLQEIVQLWQVVALQSLQGLLGGGLELPVAGLQLLQAFTKVWTSGSGSDSSAAKAGCISGGSMAVSRAAALASTAL